MFNFPKCRTCGNTLPIATGVCPVCPSSSPPPGQQDLGASLAAPAEVDQVGGTISIETVRGQELLVEAFRIVYGG